MMVASARHFCPLCRGELSVTDAVRTHLIADHKRSAAEADELIARFDTAKPIPAPEPEPHIYFSIWEFNGSERCPRGGAAAQETQRG